MSQATQRRLDALQSSIDAHAQSDHPADRAELAGLLLDRARLFDEIGDDDNEQSTLLQIVEDFQTDTHPDTLASWCTAVRMAAVNLYVRDELDAAQAIAARLRAHADNRDHRVRRQVLRSLIDQAGYMNDVRQHAATLATFDEIVSRFGGDQAPAVRELVAGAMFDRAVACDHVGDAAGENAAYHRLIEHFADESNETIRIQVCKAYVNLLFNAVNEGEYDDALGYGEAAIACVGESHHTGLQDQLARALFGCARVHDARGHHRKEQAALERVIDRLIDSPTSVARAHVASALNRKGRGLETDFNDAAGAIACYRRVVELYGATPLEDPANDGSSWEQRQHLAMLRQLSRALFYAADAWCDLRHYDQARALIEGLQGSFSSCTDDDIVETLAQAGELTERIAQLSGRRNSLISLFDMYSPYGASGGLPH